MRSPAIADRKTAAAGRLAEQIEDSFRRGKASQALRQALELERIRCEATACQAELPKLEQTTWSLGFILRQMCRRLDHIRDQLAGR